MCGLHSRQAGVYAFHCRVVLVQEARCEVGDDWMVALYDVDEASERWPFR